MLVILPFVAGQLSKKKWRESQKEKWRQISYRAALFLFDTTIAFLLFWQTHLGPREAWLPLIGFLLVIIPLFLGHWVAGLWGLSRAGRPAFALASALSNHGYAIGATVCFLFLGQEGVLLATLFILYFFPTIFSVIFAYANVMSTDAQTQGSLPLRQLLLQRHNLPILAIPLGIGMQWYGPEPMSWVTPLSTLLIILNVINVFFTFGLTMDFSRIHIYRKEVALISFTKFLATPFWALVLINIVTVFFVKEPLPESWTWVIMIEAATPSAIYSVVITSLFLFDTDRVHAYFLWTTSLFILLILPLLFLIWSWQPSLILINN